MATMSRASQQLAFRDPIHGEIVFGRRQTLAYKTPIVQRLRDLQQLGGASYVNSTLCHDRLQHSVGVSFLARKVASALRKHSAAEFAAFAAQEPFCMSADDLVDVISLAGLLHDLGHAMFSHTFEGFMELVGKPFHHEEVARSSPALKLKLDVKLS
eukprot:tig00021339_g20439.t1